MADDQREQLAQRLKSLEQRLETGKKPGDKGENATADRSPFGLAMKLSGEFIVSIAVGAGLGYMVDWLLGIKPWGMVVGLFIGFCAGVLTIMQSAGLVQEPDIMLSREARKLRTDARQKDAQDKKN